MFKTLLLLLVLGNGEHERVEVASAKVRAAMATQAVLPITPTNIVLPNVIGDTKLKVTGSAEPEGEGIGVYDITLHSTTGCAPCIALESGLKGVKELRVTKVLNNIPSWVPTSGFPFVTFKGRDGKNYYEISSRDPKKILSIVKYNCDPVNVRRLTSDELKNFASTYVGQSVGVKGMTVRQHLMDPKHGFTANQLAGLDNRELMAVHSGNHYNLIYPTMAEKMAMSGRNRNKPVGSINARPLIEKMFTTVRQYVGEGRKMGIDWDRTGEQSFEVLKSNTDYSALKVLGKSGRIGITVEDPINLPVSKGGFGYRIDGDDIAIDIDAIVFKGLAGKSDTASMSAVPMGFDPATILTVLSVIRGIYMIMNPEIDLQLGGNVRAVGVLDGDKLTITFEQGPSIRIVSIIRFQLAVESVVIEPHNVRFNYTGSNWFHYNDFAVD